LTPEYCYKFICFIPIGSNSPKFFGFTEFLTGLAFMVLAWTIADVRYRFRVRATPIPLQGITFSLIAVLGFLTLLTDLWRAENWLVPKGNLLTSSIWQALLGSIFFLNFLTWAWFAFIRPPIFGKLNAENYYNTLYRFIFNGSPSELLVIADELKFSVRPLVSYAPTAEDEPAHKLPKVRQYADAILILIADKRFCRAIVDSSPSTAGTIFYEINKSKKYGVAIGFFAQNILNEAIANKDSFLFHEEDEYQSGLMGYHKPLSQAMFSNYRMVEAIGTLLEPDIWKKNDWDADQWKAYCRVVLITLSDYVEHGYGEHSFVLYRAKGYIEHAASDLYKINGISDSSLNDDVQKRLRVVVKFTKDAIEILNKKEVPKHLSLRARDHHRVRTLYDHLASMIFEVIFSVSKVRSPANLCWWIQHNSVWGEIFNFNSLDGEAAKVVKFKVRRLIYNEIADMKRFPNFKGATILGFCLNVMGFTVDNNKSHFDSVALQKAILSWTKKNYAWLHSYNPKIAEACLVDGITYDAEHLKLIKIYPANGLRREPLHVYFEVNPPTE
jgi:hypothetical protein